MYYILFFAIAISCSPEESIEGQVLESSTDVIELQGLAKRGGVASEISIEELRDLLANNTDVISQIFVDNSFYRNFITSNRDPRTMTVNMKDLFRNAAFYSFYESYITASRVYPRDHSHIDIATYYYSNMRCCYPCGNPDHKPPWPPRRPDVSTGKSSTQFINDLIANDIVVYIPNNYSSLKDRINLYHPLNDVLSARGFRIYSQPEISGICVTTQSTEMVNRQQVDDNEFLILSRPSLENRSYSYINFDIKRLLSRTGSSSSNLSGF